MMVYAPVAHHSGCGDDQALPEKTQASLSATRPRRGGLLYLIIFPQQPNEFSHARPISPVVCNDMTWRIDFVGRSTALSRGRKQVSQFHILLRPQIRRKSESRLASASTLISSFSFRRLPM